MVFRWIVLRTWENESRWPIKFVYVFWSCGIVCKESKQWTECYVSAMYGNFWLAKRFVVSSLICFQMCTLRSLIMFLFDVIYTASSPFPLVPFIVFGDDSNLLDVDSIVLCLCMSYRTRPIPVIWPLYSVLRWSYAFPKIQLMQLY